MIAAVCSVEEVIVSTDVRRVSQFKSSKVLFSSRFIVPGPVSYLRPRTTSGKTVPKENGQVTVSNSSVDTNVPRNVSTTPLS